MSNSRFVTNNRAIGKTLLNGGGGGAPARDEKASHPMENALQADRGVPWVTSASPAGTINYDIDLGSAIAITAAGVLGFGSAATSVVQVDVSHASAYGPGPWTSDGTISLTGAPADAWDEFASVSARYWRFAFTFVSAQFWVGKLMLATPTDLGYVHAPGADNSPHGFVLAQPQIGGEIALTELSTKRGRDISLSFPLATSSLKSALEAIAENDESFIYLDPDDSIFEVHVPERRLTMARGFHHGSSFLFDCRLNLQRLP